MQGETFHFYDFDPRTSYNCFIADVSDGPIGAAVLGSRFSSGRQIIANFY